MNIKNKHSHFSWNPIHPHRDWKLLILVSVVLVLLIIAWSVYLFSTSGKGGTGLSQPEERKNATTLRLEKISSFFEER